MNHKKWCHPGVKLTGLFMAWMSLLVSPVLSCKGFSTGLGDITPDKEILVGEDLILDCILHNNTIKYENKIYEVNSSKISFKFNKELRDDRVHLITSRVARYVRPRATVDDTGTYYCLLNITDLTTRALVCLSHVKVGYKPQPVEDFKCISFSYRRLHCSWSPPYNPIETHYELEDRIHKSSALNYSGPTRKCGNSSETSCEWTVETQPPYRNTALSFYLVLTGSNRFGKNLQLFHIDHYSIIKPSKPKAFRAVSVMTNNVSLSWSAPEYIEFDDELMENLVYEIRYTKDVPNHFHNHWVIIDGIRSTEYRLTDLYPFMRYNISIRCKTIQSKGEQFWSELSSFIVTTKPDVPYLAPELIPESFQTDKNMEGLRSITLFWKAIPFEYQNGKDFHYLVEYKRVVKRFSRDLNHLNEISENPIRTPNTTFTFNHMRSDWTYSFTIHGVNAQGKSSNFSQIIIESNDLIPHKPNNIDVYSFGGGRYEIQWSRPRDSSTNDEIIKNYTVFWCQNLRPRPFPCEGPIDWVHTKNRSIALELPDVRTNYQFAVSANTETYSSGMAWAECTVPISGRLEQLSDVSLKVINSTSIKVIWKLNCPAQRRVVEGYKINYCVSKDSTCSSCDKIDFIEVDNSYENLILNDLEPFTTYRVTVLAYSDIGPSEESDRKCDRTDPASPRDAPSHLELINQTQTSIAICWETPMTPNGIIDHYKIFTNASETPIIVSAPDNCNHTSCSYVIENLKSYRWHDITVKACHNEILCSQTSPNLIVRTLEWYPYQMVPPRSEVINSTTVRVIWSPPILPNGPISYYSLKLIRSNNSTEFYNISGNFKEFELNLDCDSTVEHSTTYRPQYSVQIAAVNRQGDKELMATYSEPTNLNACLLTGSNSWVYGLGLFGGISLGLIILVLVLLSLIRWMKKRINTYRELHIDLPKSLEVPRLVTEPDGNDPFNSFSRTDSFKNLNRDVLDDESDSFKNRHGSGVSHTSNSSTELLFKSNSNQKTDNLFRMTSHDSGQHESISSHYSTEAHTSSDSGVEVDHQQQNGIPNDNQRSSKTSPKPSLPIVDEMGNSDSSGSKDSGLDVNSVTARNKKTKKRPKSSNLKANNKISSLVMPSQERNEVTNPLYDTPMTHSVCVYSLLANSEPSLFDIPVREDDNILSDLTKFTKPEMAKSLSNIIQSYSPSDHKINCIICETNNSSRASTRTSSPNCPYYKYGIKRQNHNQNSLVTNFTPEKHKQKVTKTNNGYITIDSIPSNGQTLPMIQPKKRLEHDWSQSSYDAEVSSTSSNGDNEQTDISTQNNLFTKSRLSFTECQKIQNNSSFEDNTELSVIDSSGNPLVEPPDDSSMECETQLSVVKELNTPNESTTQTKTSAAQLAKDSNGYVLHNAINQLTANQVKPKLTKNSNGYVIRDGIEMNGLVPNNVNVTQV